MPYPDSFTSITIPAGNVPLSTGSHTEVHQAEVDAIGRIEQVLGLDPAGSISTVADRLAGLGASIDELTIGKENAGVAAGLVNAAIAALEQTIGDLTASDVGADAAGSASAAVGDHVADTDPHDDRAYADGLVVDMVKSINGQGPDANGDVVIDYVDSVAFDSRMSDLENQVSDNFQVLGNAIGQVESDLADAIAAAPRRVVVGIDFGASFTDRADGVVTGLSWLTADHVLTPVIRPAPGVDVDEIRLLNMHATITDVVPGVGFRLTVTSEPEARGAYTFLVAGV